MSQFAGPNFLNPIPCLIDHTTGSWFSSKPSPWNAATWQFIFDTLINYAISRRNFTCSYLRTSFQYDDLLRTHPAALVATGIASHPAHKFVNRKKSSSWAFSRRHVESLGSFLLLRVVGSKPLRKQSSNIFSALSTTPFAQSSVLLLKQLKIETI